MNAATVAAKRPVCQSLSFLWCEAEGYRRTHEEEDAVHVALPAFCERLVILLALLENDAPELCGRIDVLVLCKYHFFRTWLLRIDSKLEVTLIVLRIFRLGL
jgi:hypothetical protein